LRLGSILLVVCVEKLPEDNFVQRPILSTSSYHHLVAPQPSTTYATITFSVWYGTYDVSILYTACVRIDWKVVCTITTSRDANYSFQSL
jgi:hypothetical protein